MGCEVGPKNSTDRDQRWNNTFFQNGLFHKAWFYTVKCAQHQTIKKRKNNLKYPDLWGYSLIVNSLFESRPKKHSNPSAYQMSKKIRKKVEISVGVAQRLRTLRLCKWIKITSNQHVRWQWVWLIFYQAMDLIWPTQLFYLS